ncbi:DUF4595 domain-containing protein [Paramuribaculum intestinale]|uniref:DUF4595 domain-containing protein n=1 Tax=Paramuribaculum intestinale TaxID=2094151 RepID=UPI0025AA1C3F|nr:DUF4595 domain-containing protein [Paramuribaculum intestinale]
MKFLKFLVVLTIGITCCMNFTSCSNEEDEPNSGASNGTVNPATVFANGIPQKVGEMNLAVNSDGLVSKITDGSVKVTFEYPCMSRANEADVVMNVSDEYDSWVIYITLNDLGYSKYWKAIYDDGDVEEYWFEYNSDNQLNKIKIQNEVNITIEYTYEKGDIIGIKITPAEGGTMKISYGVTPIKNVGGVMTWGMFFEFEDMQYAYYAGLLGKATVSLPIKNEAYIDGESSVENYTWTINEKGLPTKLTVEWIDSEGSETEDMDFVW